VRGALLGFARTVEATGYAAAVLAAACLAGIAVLVVAEVVARDVFGHSLNITWEVSGYLMGAVFLLGAAHALADGAHVRTGLNSVIPHAATRRALEAFCFLVGLIVLAYAARALWLLALQSAERGVTSWSSLRAPLWLPQGALAVGATLLAAQFAGGLARILAGEKPMRAPEPEAAAEREAL
jgi:TRAP-type C4-dicarboxylate transport system permease small subunit